ncbi:MAG: hypothetical protein Q4E61_04210, partial [Alphaproteobacteria bacterium]|nr:hypothetical protein [Alphaproteobacteria bacterium]
MTGLNKDDIFELIASAPKKKVSFLHSLANRYNSKYYYTPEANREDPKHLIELYKQIKRPKKDDFYIISSIHGTFKNLQDVFKQIKTKKDMDFVRTLQKNNIIRDSKASTTFIIDMLKSSNKKEYLKNFPEYLAYIKLNIHDADAIKKLDSMLDNKTFNAKKYNTEYALRQTINNIRYNDSVLLNMANLEKYYTPEGSKILNRFLNDYLLFREVPSIKNIEQDLLNIYSTTTKKNIKDRINLLEKIKYTSASKSEKIKDKEEVKELKLLFDRMDGSKYAKNFVRKAINSHLKIDSVRELNQILEITSPKEADIYFNNIKRMVENSSLEERETAIINGLNNPLYEPPRLKNKKKMAKMYHYTSKIGPSKTSRIAEHLKCTIIYNIMPGPQTKDIPLSKNLNNLIITLHTGSTTNAVSAKPAKINLISIPLSEKPLPIETPSINLLSKLKESPKAKRLRVINDVNNLISEKLKKSQLDKQQDLYAKNATAMRLKLLPEIFNSIKETRAVDRAVNKKKSASSNNDALTLYSKINGKNRKLIKYMLQKRNLDKTRMFEVKDIIAFIEKTENQIQKRKAIN